MNAGTLWKNATQVPATYLCGFRLRLLSFHPLPLRDGLRAFRFFQLACKVLLGLGDAGGIAGLLSQPQLILRQPHLSARTFLR